MKKIIPYYLLVFISTSAWCQTETINLTGHGQGLNLTNSADDAGTYINFIDHDGKRANIATFDDNYHTATYRNSLQFFARHGKDFRFSTSSDGNAGTNKLTILNDGKIGVGTANPFQKLTVENGQLFFSHSSVNQFESGRLRFSEYTNSFQGAFIHYNGSTNIFNIGVHSTNDTNISNDNNSLSIRRDNGSVGIGTSSTGSHKLAVEGTIGAREIKVEANGWSDFVFEKDYALRTLDEVEEHINKNGHLPEIPSEIEVAENGINLGEMDSKLLMKIEELTLYMIQMNKDMTELKAKNKKLEERFRALKTNKDHNKQ